MLGPPYQFINVKLLQCRSFPVKLASVLRAPILWNILKGYFKKPSPFWNFSAFLITDHVKCLVCEFGIRIHSKIAWKVNLWKEKIWIFIKNIVVRRNFSKISPKTVMFATHPELCLKQQIWISWHEKQCIEENRVDDL